MYKSPISYGLGMRRLFRYLKNLRDSYLSRPSDVGETRAVFVIFPISTLCIITLVPLGILALNKQNYTVAVLDLALAFLLAVNLLHARRYRNYDLNVRFGITISTLPLVYTFLTGGINGTGFVCYYAFPLIACFFLGSKKGAIATALISLPVVALFLIKTPPSLFARYSSDFKLRFLFSFLLVSVFSYLFECAREKHQEELRTAQNDLEKRMEERTLALREAEEGARRLAQENAIFAEIGRIISSTLYIDEVYDRFAAVVHRLIRFDRISICTIDSERQTISVAWSLGPDRIDRRPGNVFPLCRAGQRQFIQTRSSVFIQTDDIREIEERFPFLLPSFEYGFRSMISVPLILKDHVIGTLNLRSFKTNAYTERDLKIVESIGLQISGAITNVLLFDERKRAEEALKKKTEELARSNRDLEQFAYVATHDLQEPLRMVTSYVQLLARRYKGKLDSDADEFIRFAEDGATRMWKLINDLLAYSRVGMRSQEPKPTDCEAALLQSLDSLRMAVEENGAMVTRDPLPTVMADPLQLVQLFQNLIGNAIKFRGNEPPRIHVSASRNGDGWIFSVRDNGIGIDPEYAERIFIIFQRLHSREKYAGTGIGLAICQKIVERHGGRIWVESELGKGATFYFILPRQRKTMKMGSFEPPGDNT